MECAAYAASRPSKRRSTRSVLVCARIESSRADRRLAKPATAACIRNASSSSFPARPPCRSYWKPIPRSAPPAAECADRAPAAFANRLRQIAEGNLRPAEVAREKALRYRSLPHTDLPRERRRDRTRPRRRRSVLHDRLHSHGAPRERERKHWCQSAPSTRDNESVDSIGPPP